MDTNENIPAPIREDQSARRVVAMLAMLLTGVVAGTVGAAVERGLEGGPSASAATAPAARSPQVERAATLRSAASPAAPAGALTPEAIYRRDAPAVVVITDTQTQSSPATLFTPPLTQKVGVLGSGFVIDVKGDIVTNYHVVKGATDVRIGFSNGTTFPGKVVGADPSSDIAVVRVNAPASALHPLMLDSSSGVQVGDPAYALGNPFGLDRTLTAGIVSAVGRNIQAPNGLTIPDAIQTDAAINHGNSGGPLLDRRGRVIGINDQIESGGVNGNVTVNGVGAVVGGDAIVSLDGKPVDSVGQLADAIALHQPGQTVSLGVVRNGKHQTIHVTLGNAPAKPTAS